jgi:hypothetical protein
MEQLFDLKDFGIDSLSIKSDEIKPQANDSLEYLKGISHKLTIKDKPIIDYFFEINNIPIYRYPQYYCSPIWNDAYNSYKWRYMIINHGGLNYLVFLRIIGVMYHEQYVALSYDILCENPEKADIPSVVNILKTIDCIKKMETITDGDDWDNVNFYNDESLRLNNYKRNKVKYLMDNGIKCVVFYNNVPLSILNGIIELYDAFMQNRFKFNIKHLKRYFELSLNKGFPVFVFMYQDKVIGLRLCSNDFGNAYYIHEAKDISGFPLDVIALQYTNSDMDFAVEIKKFFGAFTESYPQTYLFDKCGVSGVFYDGIITKKKQGLFEHKNRFYKKMIKYKLVDINEYGQN